MKKDSKIYIAGHNGMVGKSLVTLLKSRGYKNLIFRTSRESDLRSHGTVNGIFKNELPEYVFLLAAKVGGIKANIEHPAEFLYDNILIEANVIQACYKYKVKKLLYLGSSCAYPRLCPQPMKECYLLSGKLEPTNEAYALAKIVGLKLCEYYNKQFKSNFICLVPPNLYGPHDNFDQNSSHVIAGLIRKFVYAQNKKSEKVELWGSGKARREFLYVDDVSKACLYFMEKFHAKDLPTFLNVGYGTDISIKDLAQLIKRKTGFLGKITWNRNMPEGMPQKLLDTSLANKFGWKAKTNLGKGLSLTIDWFKNEIKKESTILNKL